MIGNGQQAVGVRRQIDAHHFRLLVDDMIDEAGILMAEAIVILTPDMAGEQIIERGDRRAPGNILAGLDPFGVLIDHRVDDMGKSFIAVEKPVPSGEQIAFQPALA